MSSRNGWNEYALDDIASVHRGLSWSTKQERSEPVPGSVAVLRIPNVKERLDLRSIMYLVDIADDARKQCMATKNWTLLVSSNGNPDRVGDCVFIDEENDYVFASFLVAMTAKDPGIVDPRYLYRLLKSDVVQSAISRNVQGSTGLNNINLPLLMRQRVLVPPIAVQRVTCDLLHSTDDAIERTQKVISQTRKLKVALLRDLLTNGLQRRKKRNSTIGPVPESWTVQKVGDLCSFSSGHGFSHGDWSRSGLPIIRIQNLNGSQEFNYYASEPDPTWIVEVGELLFAWAGVKGVSFGPCIWPGPRGLLNQHIYRIRPNSGVNGRWLYAVLGEVTHRIEAKAHGFKTSLVHVHKADITGQLVAVPPEQEQRELATHLQDLDSLEEAQNTHLSQLIETKKSLSQSLLSGRFHLSNRGSK